MRVLLRGYKPPLASLAPVEVLRQSLLGGNSGNLLFSESVYRMLYDAGVEVVMADDRHILSAGDLGEVDAVVLPFANAFRPEYIDRLRHYTSVLERLRVPVTVLGIGAQSDLHGTPPPSEVDEVASDFIRAVLRRSPSVGVRGHFTAEYLSSLGFGSEVEVIGCPSLFRNGGVLPPTTRPDGLDESSAVSLNLTPGVHHPGLLGRHLERYPRLTYVAQGQTDLRLMLWGDGVGAEVDDDHPRHPDHPVFTTGAARFFVDASTWLRFQRTQAFTFGTRIHGNVAALLAGRAAHVLAHDSRTLELAEYFEIPHTRVDQMPAGVDAADLLGASSYRALHRGHAERWARFSGYLDDHGVPHSAHDAAGPSRFDTEVAALSLPGAVEPLTTAPRDEIIRRLRWAYRETKRLRRAGSPARSPKTTRPL